MAKKLKDYYDRECAKLIAGKIKTVCPEFADKKFIDLVARGVKGLEFTARQDVFVQAFDKHLPYRYEKVIGFFTKILVPKLEKST